MFIITIITITMLYYRIPIDWAYDFGPLHGDTR